MVPKKKTHKSYGSTARVILCNTLYDICFNCFIKEGKFTLSFSNKTLFTIEKSYDKNIVDLLLATHVEKVPNQSTRST
jgi:hypothetical protein